MFIKSDIVGPDVVMDNPILWDPSMYDGSIKTETGYVTVDYPAPPTEEIAIETITPIKEIVSDEPAPVLTTTVPTGSGGSGTAVLLPPEPEPAKSNTGIFVVLGIIALLLFSKSK